MAIIFAQIAGKYKKTNRSGGLPDLRTINTAPVEEEFVRDFCCPLRKKLPRLPRDPARTFIFCRGTGRLATYVHAASIVAFPRIRRDFPAILSERWIVRNIGLMNDSGFIKKILLAAKVLRRVQSSPIGTESLESSAAKGSLDWS